MTSFTLSSASPAKTKTDAVVVGVVQSEPTGRRASKEDGPVLELAAGAEDVAKAYGRKLRPLLASLDVKGSVGEVTRVPTSGTIGAPLLVLVGLGKDPQPADLRRAAGAASRAVTNAADVALALPAETAADVRAVAEGWALGAYTFTTYKQDTAKDATTAGEVVLLSSAARDKQVVAALEEAQVVTRAVAATRDWVNTPPGDLRPPAFAEAAQARAKELGKGRGAPKIMLRVLDEVELAELGCGGILGVGVGSSAPPRLVEISYTPKGATTHLALVGKGITFDSGGLSIKPAQGMHEMKSDMAGAAAVIQATFAIAELGLPVKVSCFAPMAENMVSGDATRPGDILSMYGGKTVEVLNTDAEGRLVLGDALVRAVETEPDLIVDVATLTGAMVVALGNKMAGVMGSEEVVAKVVEAGASAGEPIWAMPIPEEMKQRVTSSKIADLAQHDWVRWGGGLFAGAFLREFTDGRPWAHLDIAGPSFNAGGPDGHLTNGGTGFAVSTLVDLARGLA
ncbi:MAG: leucyl aminopeptidase [Nocardioides marinisabuli]|uniref:leucyl aminopeptidase n=1 Tax=Nocardioides marinisabuli TaxID=419476 RepID=UPI00321985F8